MCVLPEFTTTLTGTFMLYTRVIHRHSDEMFVDGSAYELMLLPPFSLPLWHSTSFTVDEGIPRLASVSS